VDFFNTAQGRVYARALDARDARFDGVFFVGITTTKIYCRPVCPARVAYHSHRRFFAVAAAAEDAGYRPCLRCRPELAPGRASWDAVSRIASIAERRIAAGALNGRSVAELARDLGVSERHLRRALERALGVSPVKLAQTHRLLFAKRLLADTRLPITQVAFASGFQSLRRFNASFAEQYRMPPSAVRRVTRASKSGRASRSQELGESLRLTLSYRAPLAWRVLVECLAGDGVGGVEIVDGRRYGRTVEIDGRSGVVFAQDAADASGRHTHVNVDISASLVPALMPLLACLRQLFDLDEEPAAIDAHLSQGGLGALVAANPGVRLPGAIDGFDIALRAILRGRARPVRATSVSAAGPSSADPAARVAWELGEAIDTGIPELSRLSPTAARIVEAGSAQLVSLGVSRARAECAVTLARVISSGELALDAGRDLASTRRALASIRGNGEQVETMLITRALRWPDALPASDALLQRAAHADSPRALQLLSEPWRPWRAYAALHLWLEEHPVHFPPAQEAACPTPTHASLAS
jgi:AraC family transcriptional regulator of adaptative response / DNA-3-methyladenine glycosylase II